MPLDTNSDVVLTRDVPEHGVRAGDIGTVVERHVVPGVREEGYSVEFFDMAGNTVAVATLPASALRQPNGGGSASRAGTLRLKLRGSGRAPQTVNGSQPSAELVPTGGNWGRQRLWTRSQMLSSSRAPGCRTKMDVQKSTRQRGLWPAGAPDVGDVTSPYVRLSMR